MYPLHLRPLFLLLLALGLLPATAGAGGVYQEPDAFIAQVFDGQPPKARVLWLDKALKNQLADILGHPYRGMRVRYWQKGARSAWILEEIGKEKPITTGIVVNRGKIERVKVLVFRESRGWEVRHDFFTNQFKQAELEEGLRLSKHIDNISGATLSVRALRKLATVALLLDARVQRKALQKSTAPEAK